MTRGIRAPKNLGMLFAAGLLFAQGARSAHAQAAPVETKRTCAAAAETAQRLRARGLLLDARGQLRTCSRDECPAAVRADCQEWLAEIERSLPAAQQDGGPARVEPPSPASAPTPAPATAPAPAPATAAPLAPSPAPSGASPGPLAWISAGVSLVALGSFAYFAATGTSDLSRLRDECAGHCAQSDVDAAWSKLVTADISLAVGVVSGGLAGWLFFQASRASHDGPPADTHLGVVLHPGGAEADWKVRF
jgi:hypothetical protein